MAVKRGDKRFPGSFDARFRIARECEAREEAERNRRGRGEGEKSEGREKCVRWRRETGGEGERGGKGVIKGTERREDTGAPFQRHPFTHFTISINIKSPSPNDSFLSLNRRALRSFAALNAPGMFAATLTHAEILSNARVSRFAPRKINLVDRGLLRRHAGVTREPRSSINGVAVFSASRLKLENFQRRRGNLCVNL